MVEGRGFAVPLLQTLFHCSSLLIHPTYLNTYSSSVNLFDWETTVTVFYAYALFLSDILEFYRAPAPSASTAADWRVPVGYLSTSFASAWGSSL